MDSCVSRCTHFRMLSLPASTSFLLMMTTTMMMMTLSGVAMADEVFGMKLTTEKAKTREDTKYFFRYYVKDDKTGDFKMQEETKEGDSVRGSYTIAEPSGDLRKVTYKAEPERGFEASVDVEPNTFQTKAAFDKTSAVDATTVSSTRNKKNEEKKETLESTVKHIPGGYIMDILSKPEAEKKTEIGVKFTMGLNSSTKAAESTVMVTESETTEREEITTQVVQDTSQETSDGFQFSNETQTSAEENTTFSVEGRDIGEDPVEKEINDAINFMPKLPEYVLPDNVTHLKFYKDPEEALIDERITQIARQLAETSLRREYEERKLGHYIPISVKPIERSTSGYLSKSFKFTENAVLNLTPSNPPPVQVIAQVRVVPTYIYDQTIVPDSSPIQNRLPVVNRPLVKSENDEQSSASNATELKFKKLDPKSNEILKAENLQDNTIQKQVPVIPVQIPTFFQVFTPVQRYVMHTPKSVVTENKAEPHASGENTTRSIPLKNNASFYVSMLNAQNKSKDLWYSLAK